MRIVRVALSLALVATLVVPANAFAAGSDSLQNPSGKRTGTKSHTAPRRQSNPLLDRMKQGSLSKIDGQLVVRTEPAARSRVRARLIALGCTIKKTGYSGALLVSVPAARQDFVSRSVRAMSGVLSVEQAVGVRAAATPVTPTDPRFAEQWGLERIGAPNAWGVTLGSDEVTVAVIDTGVDAKHPDLESRVATREAYDFISNRPGAADDEGHGTHVAGIIAASMNDTCGVGVAPNVTILPVKVLNADGWGTDFSVAQGIMYAADHGADIINMSLGAWFGSEELVSAVEYAQAKGALIVASSGNESWRVSYPACLPGVLSVGATGYSDKIASFSNTGPELDIVAPGIDIMSTKRGGGMTMMTGTSMAAPMVAGAAALVKTVDPDLTADEISERLTSTAEDRGPVGKDFTYGYGRLNVAKALGESGGTDSNLAQPTDNEFPGVALRPASSPATVTTEGTLDIDSDQLDTYYVDLEQGQRIELSMDAPLRSEMSLLLFSPAADSVWDAWPLAWGESNWRLPAPYPQTIAYTAPRAGRFRVLVYAEAGNGPYAITSVIKDAKPSDDELPGVEPTPDTIIGKLDTRNDEMDIYRVHLEKGQRLAARLDSPRSMSSDWFYYEESYEYGGMDGESSAEFQIGTAGPDAWSAEDLWGWGGDMEGVTSITAEEEGDYYLWVYAYSGRSPYGITWKILDPGSDDELPGVPLPDTSGTLSAEVDAPFDYDDIYSIELQEGDRINVSVESSPTPKRAPHVEADVGLIDASSESLADATYLEISALEGTRDAFSYTVLRSGTYRIQVRAFGNGTANYTMRWSVQDAGTPAIAGTLVNPRPAYNGTATIEADVTSGGAPMADQAVMLQTSYGDGWDTEDVALADADGHVEFARAPRVTEQVRLVVLEADGDPVVSDAWTIKPQMHVNRPRSLGGSTVAVRDSRVWTVRSWPAFYADSKYDTPVWFRIQRSDNGVWKTTQRIRARQTGETTYRRTVRLYSPGQYRITAYHPEDPWNAYTMGQSTYFTVR